MSVFSLYTLFMLFAQNPIDKTKLSWPSLINERIESRPTRQGNAPILRGQITARISVQATI